jgi:hypothetical protein
MFVTFVLSQNGLSISLDIHYNITRETGTSVAVQHSFEDVMNILSVAK